MVKIDREAVRQILPDQLNIKKVCENGPQKSYSGAERQPKKNCSDILKCINAQMNLLEKFITFAEKKLTIAVKIDFSMIEKQRDNPCTGRLPHCRE